MAPRNELRCVEKDRQLALRALRRIASVRQIAPNRLRKVGANRSWGCRERVRSAQQLTASRDRAFALDAHGNQRSARDEFDQCVKERLAIVLGVMAARTRTIELHQLHRDDEVAAAFQAADNFADQTARNGVGFAQNQRALDGHRARGLRPGGKEGLRRETRRVHRFEFVRHVAETGSTNDDMAQILGEPQSRGLTIVADRQTEGKGRHGRRWIAPAGSALLFTTALPEPLLAADLWIVPFWIALVLHRALVGKGFKNLLQWPNDLLIGGRKAGGVLCISRVSGDLAWGACGVGLNVRRPPRGTEIDAVDPPPAFLSDVRPVERDELLQAILREANESYEELRAPDQLARRWEAAADIPGAHYRIVEDAGAPPFEGVALRLAHGGGLVLRDRAQVREVALADARVDRR